MVSRMGDGMGSDNDGNEFDVAAAKSLYLGHVRDVGRALRVGNSVEAYRLISSALGPLNRKNGSSNMVLRSLERVFDMGSKDGGLDEDILLELLGDIDNAGEISDADGRVLRAYEASLYCLLKYGDTNADEGRLAA